MCTRAHTHTYACTCTPSCPFGQPPRTEPFWSLITSSRVWSLAALRSPLVHGHGVWPLVLLAFISWHVLSPLCPWLSHLPRSTHSSHVQVQATCSTANHHDHMPASKRPVASLGQDAPKLWQRALLFTAHWPEIGRGHT